MDKYFNQTLSKLLIYYQRVEINAAINIFDTLSYKYPKNSDVMHMKAFACLQSNNIQKQFHLLKML